MNKRFVGEGFKKELVRELELFADSNSAPIEDGYNYWSGFPVDHEGISEEVSRVVEEEFLGNTYEEGEYNIVYKILFEGDKYYITFDCYEIAMDGYLDTVTIDFEDLVEPDKNIRDIIEKYNLREV